MLTADFLSTNDVNIGKRDVNTILGAYTSIVNAIRSANPKAKIIVRYCLSL